MKISITPSFLSGNIQAVSSKSDIHRLMFCAAAADKPTTVITNCLSEDINASIDALRESGADITVKYFDSGYHIIISPVSKKNDHPMIDCGECGTTARFILPFAAVFYDKFTVTGSAGLVSRPFGELLDAMSLNGCRASSPSLPAEFNNKLKPGAYSLPGNISSQFVSALLIALPLLDGPSEIHLSSPLQSSGYVDMTISTLEKFNIKITKTRDGYKIKPGIYKSPGTVRADGDWSNSAFWICAGAINGDIILDSLNNFSLQKDKKIIDILKSMNCDCGFSGDLVYSRKSSIKPVEIDAADIPDLVMALAPVMAYADGRSVIYSAERLLLKESDRIKSILNILTVMGIRAGSDGSRITINGSNKLQGGTAEAYNDHRAVMLAATAAVGAAGNIVINGYESVNKSYPDYFKHYKFLGGKCDVI